MTLRLEVPQHVVSVDAAPSGLGNEFGNRDGMCGEEEVDVGIAEKDVDQGRQVRQGFRIERGAEPGGDAVGADPRGEVLAQGVQGGDVGSLRQVGPRLPLVDVDHDDVEPRGGQRRQHRVVQQHGVGDERDAVPARLDPADDFREFGMQGGLAAGERDRLHALVFLDDRHVLQDFGDRPHPGLLRAIAGAAGEIAVARDLDDGVRNGVTGPGQGKHGGLLRGLATPMRLFIGF